MSGDGGSAVIAGWHGKLPSLGDFASRRLDADFVAVWDGWLAAGLASLRQQSPEGWLQHYLACPAWRFVLMPGALPAPFGDAAYAGVLMPSVDRIGRYFPLTLIAPLPAPPRTEVELRQLLSWLHDLDDLAVDALQDDWPIERLESELTQCPRPHWDATPEPSPLLPTAGGFASHLVAGTQAIVDLLAGGQAQALRQQAAGHAFWWADGETGERRLLATHGLPQTDDMRLLFGAAPPASS
ncbi:MAG: type VI secretion system-associated protein TagF [Burkholderiales bacterium]|nr:type VI secretion system-associated protein TagF [Burkholderiales bacterium]